MGRRGPAKEPTVLKLLKGNPGCRRINKLEPQPSKDAINPPAWLTGVSLKKWNELVPQLIELGVMTNVDVEAIARYCTMHEQFLRTLAEVRAGRDIFEIKDSNGKTKYIQATPWATMLTKVSAMMLRVEQEFGLTSSSRSGIIGKATTPEKSKLQEFLARRTKA